jgi:hypothetical protein
MVLPPVKTPPPVSFILNQRGDPPFDFCVQTVIGALLI